jgi:hypothetical protein|tara:strand:+ start:286 stop:477 length:192 start_codon:yes stop_codon:yes gene_type:complete
MIALMGATNPFWEYLLIPLSLFGAGIAAGWYIRSIDAEPEPEPFRQASSVRILRDPYNWADED